MFITILFFMSFTIVLAGTAERLEKWQIRRMKENGKTPHHNWPGHHRCSLQNRCRM